MMMNRWMLFLLLLAAPGCFNGLVISPVNVNAPLDESVVHEADGWTFNKIALIDVSGLIMNARISGLLSDGENPVSLFREKLEHAAADSSVKAVVLRINSPGGAVTASDIMYRDLQEFREKSNKPVVACMMDVAASGGYYLAMAADSVYAHPTTTTGSIGVILSLYNAEELCKKLGVESDPIKSGPNKDLANPTRKLTPEERAILQSLVNQFYERFVTLVATGRRLSVEEVRPLADGRVYGAQEAKNLGLVDEIGYLEDAIREAKLRAGVRDATVIAYDRDPGNRATIHAGMPRIPSTINVKLEVPGLDVLGLNNPAGATFLYLWQPGLGAR
jgi:protease-4